MNKLIALLASMLLVCTPVYAAPSCPDANEIASNEQWVPHKKNGDATPSQFMAAVWLPEAEEGYNAGCMYESTSGGEPLLYRNNLQKAPKKPKNENFQDMPFAGKDALMCVVFDQSGPGSCEFN